MAKEYKRKYTQREWDEADDIGKMYITLIDERWEHILSESLVERRENIKKAWVIMMGTPSPKERTMKVMEATGLSETGAYKQMKFAEELFGKLIDINPWIERRVVYTRLVELAKKAEDDEDIETAIKAFTKAADLLTKIEGEKKPVQKVYKAISITTNPDALASRLGNIAEADFEEMDDESIPQPQATPVLLGQ
jgi:hypothetical protein